MPSPPEYNQLQLFRDIWAEREHKSQISGTPIHFDVSCFAHVLGKGAYPAFKLYKKNIVLMTPAEHHVFDAQTHLAKDDTRFDWVFELAEQLKHEYHQKMGNEGNHHKCV